MKYSTVPFAVLVSLFVVGCGKPAAPPAVQPPAEVRFEFKALPELEADVLKELTAVRANPKSYLDRLKSFLPKFDGKILRMSPTLRFNTNEGRPCVEEAIEALEKQEARGAYLHSEPLRRASLDHLADQIKNGGTGHYGSDKSSPHERMLRYADLSASGEIINYNTYGGEVSGAAVVASFIIDDGVPDRGHRTGVFYETFTHAGVACGIYPGWGPSCVIDMGTDPKAK